LACTGSKLIACDITGLSRMKWSNHKSTHSFAESLDTATVISADTATSIALTEQMCAAAALYEFHSAEVSFSPCEPLPSMASNAQSLGVSMGVFASDVVQVLQAQELAIDFESGPGSHPETSKDIQGRPGTSTDVERTTEKPGS
jgi:hypothetical protein